MQYVESVSTVQVVMCEIKAIYHYCFIYHHAIIWEDGDFDL